MVNTEEEVRDFAGFFSIWDSVSELPHIRPNLIRI
jgi:hypothetical protein